MAGCVIYSSLAALEKLLFFPTTTNILYKSNLLIILDLLISDIRHINFTYIIVMRILQVDQIIIGVIRLGRVVGTDRKSTRLNSSHVAISYAVFCLKKKKKENIHENRIQTNIRTYC